MRFALLSTALIAALHTACVHAFAINPCVAFGELDFSPAHPGPNDAVGFIVSTSPIADLADGRPTPVVARAVLDGNTVTIDVVVTNTPDAYPAYARAEDNYFDGAPAGFVGPLVPGLYSVVLSAQVDASVPFRCPAVARRATLDVGAQPAQLSTVSVVEYYHAARDQYFITQDAGEIADLDTGVHPGWTRTGESFVAYRAGGSDGRGVPVQRSYLVIDHRYDTHFFVAGRPGGGAPFALPVDWRVETQDAFEIALPERATGRCPAGTVPLHRLWNGRIDTGHRYTTRAAVVAQMQAQGWIAEGYGPDAVILCALG